MKIALLEFTEDDNEFGFEAKRQAMGPRIIAKLGLVGFTDQTISETRV